VQSDGFTPKREETPIVYLAKLEYGAKSLASQFNRSFSTLSIPNDFNKVDAVFIKPNLTYPFYKKGVTTRKEFVENLVAVLREINTTTKIYIGEGEGGYNSFSMTDALRSMGYYDIQKKYPNVEIVNLTQLPSRKIELKVGDKPYWIDLPEFFFDEIGFSISCPLPKVHCMTKVTLSFKNQWGCLPDTMRLKNHFIFDEVIGQISKRLKFHYAFLDGRYGLDQNGPMVGTPKRVDWFVAANDLGAFDIIVSEMMGFKWSRVRHLKKAAHYGFIPKKNQIKIIGDLEELKESFVLKRDFWNYPALVAFHSSKLTHLFYLSGWSKLLHDIMYTFRKRPIEE